MGAKYAKQRVTFGKPLSERQAIQWMLADSCVKLHAARLMVYHVAWKNDQGEDMRPARATKGPLGEKRCCRMRRGGKKASGPMVCYFLKQLEMLKDLLTP